MNENTTILVTGAAGVTARAFVRSLRHGKYKNCKIIGTDSETSLKYGFFEKFYDQFIQVPKVDHPDYKEFYLSLISKFNPNAVIFMPELEALYWSGNSTIKSLLPSFRVANNIVDKVSLHILLDKIGLVPNHIILKRNKFYLFESLLKEKFRNKSVWVRSVKIGSSSGLGSMKIRSLEEFNAWTILNPNVEEIMVSELLSGRNLAHNVLVKNGRILAECIYERLEYFMGHLVPSGVSGNISKGRLIEDNKVLNSTIKIIDFFCKNFTSEEINGLFTIDYKESEVGSSMVTEINLRHTAATESFALGGYNMSEFHLDVILGNFKENQIVKKNFSKQNVFFRDIDGLPIYLDNPSDSFKLVKF